MRNSFVPHAALYAACLILGACGTDAGDSSGDNSSAATACEVGTSVSCACTNGATGTQACLDDGSYGPCLCANSPPAAPSPGPAPTTPSMPGSASSGPVGGGTAGASGAGGSGSTPPPPPPPNEPPTEPPPEPPTEPPPEPPTEPPPPDPTDPFSALRQACVDHINMYRATLGLEPLMRAPNDVERCSDRGAEQDATTGQAHGSAGSCPGLGAQNTCPGWNPQWAGGSEEGALLSCLDAMWDEGEPPISRQECIADRRGCFLEHGHYLNMSSTSSTVVSCGFYRMPDGRIWMNQDFGR